MTAQESIFDFHLCPTCRGAAMVLDHERDEKRPCRVCEGTGVVPYDPDDRSEIPYG